MSIIYVDALVVGSGAAGYNAACRIAQEGKKSVAIVTEGVMDGTSRNTGSDKQTYYKLGLSGEHSDSVRLMAQDLFNGGAVDGDNALCEAALSARCFMNLCEAGVPFPVNRYGEYIGYKTDHDPYARATSAGPLTSQFMTQALEANAQKLNIPIYDEMYAVEIIKAKDRLCGLICLEKTRGKFVVFQSQAIVLATGGPAGIYADSVYPQCHFGASSLAFRAGAAFQNMTEWQYGLASTQPRWNVSGTYMQVLPRFVSVDEMGTEREFLLEHFEDPYKAMSSVFLKGYQWPFDSAKVMDGSSVIDLLVYRESVFLKRKVFLDYRSNPFGLTDIDYRLLSTEAYNYLSKAEACFGTPIQRLMKMNLPAVALYRNKGVDIERKMLPIALCAQHNNGGISVDHWWQTTVNGLYAVGECAGTHGISRPGGSALNAGQVGSLRAAQHLSNRSVDLTNSDDFQNLVKQRLGELRSLCDCVLSNDNNVAQWIQSARQRMSNSGAAIRDPELMRKTLESIRKELPSLNKTVGVASPGELYLFFRLKDVLISQQVCLEAMLDYVQTVGCTRGSALYTDPKGKACMGLEDIFRFVSEPKAYADKIQQGVFERDHCAFTWRKVRPLPVATDVFETVWRRYREDKNIY